MRSLLRSCKARVGGLAAAILAVTVACSSVPSPQPGDASPTTYVGQVTGHEGARIGIVLTHVAGLPADPIVAQSPAPGTLADEDRQLGIRATTGKLAAKPGDETAPNPVVLPRVIGLTADQATTELRATGVRTADIKVVPASLGNIVLRQDPAPGSSYLPGRTVTLTVGAPPEATRTQTLK